MDATESADSEPFHLSSEEAEMLRRVACRLVETAAQGTRASIRKYPLGRLAKYPLVGVFVTLRKQGELRGCIGNFADSTPLDDALERAANGVVSNDPRFPPVAPDELVHLTLSVSLLHTRESLEGSPRQRTDQVTIGQHGLDIQFQGQRGLLLPSVATDFNLDSTGFLQAVCRKARLPDDAWQDRDATLYRFSAIALGGPWLPAD